MLIVQKFGGSSVADAAKIERVAGIIADTYNAGNDVVVVLSAQGDTTDDLIDKAHEISANPSKREMDMLLSVGEQISVSLMAMQLEKMGLRAVSLAGWQIGMQTNSTYGSARIKKVTGERIRQELDAKKIVLVARISPFFICRSRLRVSRSLSAGSISPRCRVRRITSSMVFCISSSSRRT